MITARFIPIVNDETAGRLEKLRALMKARGWRVSDLVTKGGRSASFWYDLLRGEKSFGEKLARDLEQEDRLDLPRGWFDGTEEQTLAVSAQHVQTMANLLKLSPARQAHYAQQIRQETLGRTPVRHISEIEIEPPGVLQLPSQAARRVRGTLANQRTPRTPTSPKKQQRK